MKKIFSLTLLITISIASSSQIFKGKATKEFNPNMELLSVGYFNKNGEKNGKWIYYHDNGMLKEFGYYKNGLKTAEWQRYSEDGKLTHVSYYELEHRPAGWTADQLTKVDSFNINTRNWKFKLYYYNGQLQSKGKYKNGYRKGKWTSYYESGQLKSKKHYNKYQDDGKQILYFENGNKKTITQYKNTKLYGKTKHFYEDGNLEMIGNYSADKLVGERTFYDKNKNKINGNIPKFLDLYLTSVDGEKITNYSMGDTLYLVAEMEFMKNEVMSIQISDDDYEGTIFQFGEVGLYNGAIDDIEVTADTVKLKIISIGKDPDRLWEKKNEE